MQNSSLFPSRRRLIVAIGVLGLALVLGLISLFKTTPTPGSGAALVGGPFTMVNHLGETVTEKTYAGKHMLVFFGFTYCPDICPTELQVMTAALQQLGSDADKIVPILVSVDPARDTPETLKSYVENFSPALQGLTGSPEQVAAMAKAYRVFYVRVENAKSPQDYTMDHSSIIYLMGPDGQFVKHFSYTTDAAALAAGLKAAL